MCARKWGGLSGRLRGSAAGRAAEKGLLGAWPTHRARGPTASAGPGRVGVLRLLQRRCTSRAKCVSRSSTGRLTKRRFLGISAWRKPSAVAVNFRPAPPTQQLEPVVFPPWRAVRAGLQGGMGRAFVSRPPPPAPGGGPSPPTHTQLLPWDLSDSGPPSPTPFLKDPGVPRGAARSYRVISHCGPAAGVTGTAPGRDADGPLGRRSARVRAHPGSVTDAAGLPRPPAPLGASVSVSPVGRRRVSCRDGCPAAAGGSASRLRCSPRRVQV